MMMKISTIDFMFVLEPLEDRKINYIRKFFLVNPILEDKRN